MNPGDLVELVSTQADELVIVGDFDDSASRRFVVGTLAMVISNLTKNELPAVLIMIDGSQGWVWDGEIRLVGHSMPPTHDTTTTTSDVDFIT